jgi:putative ABC transport system permease protein
MRFALFSESFAMAIHALAANRLRSLLALVGVVIGVATVIGMVSLINGFQRSVEDSIHSMGTNTIYIHRIRPGVNVGGNIPDSLKQRKAFTIADGQAILAQCPSVRAISAMKYDFIGLRIGYRGNLSRGTNVYGTDDQYLIVHGYDIARGRFFTPQEVERRANVVVLGPTTREALFKNHNPLGETVHIGTIPFTVIGEYTPKGKLLGQDLDAAAAIP